MTEPEFWNLIDEARQEVETLEDVVDYLRVTLELLSLDDVVDFQRVLNTVLAQAYSWELIAAACFLGCGLSDDGFLDFRAWLVVQGRDTFVKVLSNVNALADLEFESSPTEEWYCEELLYLPTEVAVRPDDFEWPYQVDPERLHGIEITLTKDALRCRFPQLWERFGDQFMIGIQ